MLASQPTSSTSPTHSRSAANRRLSLSALCNPSPGPAMSNDSLSAGPSSPRPSDIYSNSDRSAEPNKLSLNADDESVMIAVSALDDMRSGAKNGTSASSSPSSSFDSGSPSVSTSLSTRVRSTSPEESANGPQFVSRMTGIPIVNTALRAYEQSKASSRVVKYGAEMMESSVRRVSKPVIDRLPVNQIDEFACRQLDRFGKYGSDNRNPSRENARKEEDNDSSEPHTSEVDKETRRLINGDAHETPVQGKVRKTLTRAMPDNVAEENDSTELTERTPSSQDVTNRSRWHSLLYEAGGISAAVSEESMRRLKFCLQWLQYATDHIDGQILVLRNFIASLNAQAENGDVRPISASHLQTLTNVKREVVKTVRQMVDVVSKYAGAGLPEPARTRVRQFILHLPQRWASSTRRQGQAPAPGHSPGQSKPMHKRHRSGLSSANSTAPSSPLHSPKVMPRGMPHSDESDMHRQTMARPTASSVAQAATRILTLATESLDMMRNVTGIVKESLDRADVWVDRLRVMGLQRRNLEASSDDAVDSSVRRMGSDVSIGTLTSAGSSTTATFTSFPPSPRSWPVDAPSPGSLTATHFDSLTLNSLSAAGSALTTPRSSTQSLPALGGYDWEYTARKLQTIRDADETREDDEDEDDVIKMNTDAEERSAVTALSALRSSTRPTSMDVDGKE